MKELVTEYTVYTTLLTLFFSGIICEDCGPLGYQAESLLAPSYWYFDLRGNECPPPPAELRSMKRNVNTTCRIYFNLCQKLTYQCSGTVCVRYTDTKDLVALLGGYDKHPFLEPLKDNDFIADYVGERLACKNKDPVKTRFYFLCAKNATWSKSNMSAHGGFQSPRPAVSFDADRCQLTFTFNYSGACWKPGDNDSPVTNISMGTFVLILFFPSVLLYFLMGTLFNCSRGKTGVAVIPHHKLLEDLPELILDGFMFTVAVITCSGDARQYTGGGYEEVVGS